ncbi:MAG: D-alanine--D-alanine ligase [Acidobacteria bacterium]|nr:D-alanine--D-alanine ligase [Acidobacteriota bacterium]
MKPLTGKERERLAEIRRSKTIGVLMGGPSEERDISRKSGAAVLMHLFSRGYRVEPCDFQTEEELCAQLEANRIELAFLALHGRYGEDGEVQKLLASRHIPHTGSSASTSRLAFDKWASHGLLRENGLLTPEAVVLAPQDPLPSVSRFPVVVKPVRQGSSLGLSIVDSPHLLPAAVQEAFRYDDRLLIEQYIGGTELTVGILGEEALPVIQILPAGRFYDYDSKYVNDKTQFLIPAPIEEPVTRSVQIAALRAHHALGCGGFSRVDLLLNQESDPVILEVNTIPGLTSRSLLPRACEAVNISFLELCERALLLALGKEQVAQRSSPK